MTGILKGRVLTALAAVLMAAAGAGAVGVAAREPLRLPEAEGEFSARAPGPGVAESVARAREAERLGDVTAALAWYRKAAARDPRILDRSAPGFLGEPFEVQVRAWIRGLKEGRLAAGPTALPDASYLFRRMYGGCG